MFKRQRNMIFFSLAFSILAAVHLVPPNYRNLVWLMRARALARVVHGLGEFFVYAVQYMWGGPSPAGTFIGLSLLAPIVWLAARRLWTDPNEGRPTMLLFAALNPIIGILTVYAGCLLVEEPHRECRLQAAEGRLLEIVSYAEIGWNAEQRLFLLSSTDDGESWSEVMYVTPISPSFSCGTLARFDEQFYAYWIGWKLAVTHDGGASWAVWDPSQLTPDWYCCSERLIRSVIFTGPSTGIMEGSFGFVDSDYLITNDGGKTWMVP